MLVNARISAPILVTLLVACGGSQSTPTGATPVDPSQPTAPVAEKRDHQVVSPNGTRADPYFWLRDDERKDPAVLSHLKAENIYAEAMLAPTAALSESLYTEMIGRLKQDDTSVPVYDNGFWYQAKFSTGAEYRVRVRKKTPTGPEQVLLDENVAAKGHPFYRAGGMAISPDNKWMAVAEDTVGRNQYKLRIVSLDTGKTLADSVSNIQSGVAWANDNKTIFYVERHPKTLLGYRVRRHVVGTDVATDPIVYEEKDTSFYMGVSRTKSGKFVVIGLGSTVSSEVRLIEADNPAAEPTMFHARERDHEFDIDHFNGRFVARTNWKAPNYRLVEIPEATSTDRSSWKEIVAHRADAFIHSFDLQRDFMAVGERSGGLRRVRVVPKDKASFVIPATEAASTMFLHSQPSGESNVVRYSYTSMTTPSQTHELEVASGKTTMLKEQPVLGDFNRENYASEYTHATARDGTKVPVSIVYRKGLVKDGTAPIVEYGYGSYGISMDPTFSSTRISFLDRGVVYAIAHIRGGQEMGRAWYDDGRLLNKMNTFTDFVDVRDFLVEQKYGDGKKVFALGGSAGGLLVGAVTNLAAEKYRGVMAWVPFVDVTTTMLDDTIPLTSNEYDEWGNPQKKAYYDYMMTYSPYDNVSERAYPAMFVSTGLWDSQVQYWEPAKWVAKLRENNRGANPIVFHVNMDAGHGGKSGRYRKYRETARDYAWVLHTASVPDPRSAAGN